MTNQEIIDAAERHAAGLHAQLSKPDWRPSRAHVEQARNSIAKLIDALRAAARPALPTREAVQDTWLVGGPDLKAMSGDIESDRVIKLHFKRSVNDKDRQWLLQAINDKIAADSQPALDEAALTGEKD